MPAPKSHQAPLFPSPRKAKPNPRTYEGRNLEAAIIILADPDLHGGEGSLPVVWARKVAGIEAKAL